MIELDILDHIMSCNYRSKNLKHLRLWHYIRISDEALVEAVKKLPALEEVEIIMCKFREDTTEAIGHACPSLKAFSLNSVGSKTFNYTCNEEALAIAKTMHNLRNLQLIGNRMTNEGLKAILDGCPLLESLDIRTCFYIDLSGDLGKRYYSYQACTDSEKYSGYKLRRPYNEYDYDDSGLFGFDAEYLSFQNNYPFCIDYDGK
ncbi:putative F-box/LRR-repeat protein 23 [Chenopodium quinoa]|uniref:putative F-box/LRR-repeat protein 23 n=1 Tax=Chenopodium quinoa TaxID=63459 RepID=UPI000B7956B6|nr:putative F-box/LRR-repeat protein 23 [Chenopodium quinoa]